MTLIRLSGVTKTFPPQTRGAEPVVAVDDVSLAVAAGEICGIIGYSGAGKSTVLRLVNALETPSSGTVEIDGVDITGLGERELRRLRGDIGMIFQQFNLFDSRTVAGNIAYPLEVAGRPRAEIRARVDELLEQRAVVARRHDEPVRAHAELRERRGDLRRGARLGHGQLVRAEEHGLVRGFGRRRRHRRLRDVRAVDAVQRVCRSAM